MCFVFKTLVFDDLLLMIQIDATKQISRYCYVFGCLWRFPVLRTKWLMTEKGYSLTNCGLSSISNLTQSHHAHQYPIISEYVYHFIVFVICKVFLGGRRIGLVMMFKFTTWHVCNVTCQVKQNTFILQLQFCFFSSLFTITTLYEFGGYDFFCWCYSSTFSEVIIDTVTYTSLLTLNV